MKNPIYLCLAHMGGSEQRYIQEAFDTNWVVPLGPNVNGFEEDLERFLQSVTTSTPASHVCALSAGPAALHLAMVLLGIKARVSLLLPQPILLPIKELLPSS